MELSKRDKRALVILMIAVCVFGAYKLLFEKRMDYFAQLKVNEVEKVNSFKSEENIVKEDIDKKQGLELEVLVGLIDWRELFDVEVLFNDDGSVSLDFKGNEKSMDSILNSISRSEEGKFNLSEFSIDKEENGEYICRLKVKLEN